MFVQELFSDRVKTIGNIDPKEGGSFISDNNMIKSIFKPNVVDLVSSFVNFTSKKYTKFDNAVHDCVPENIVDFEYGSRSDKEYCLLKRCICHAMYNRCESLVHSEMELFTIKEACDIGIDITHKIPAIMKDCYYIVKTAFTKDKLLWCECTCECSVGINEQIICLHSLVPVFLITLLLCEGLAEYFLLELSTRLSVISDIYDVDTQSQFLDNIQLLIACADGLTYDYESSKKVKDYNF